MKPYRILILLLSVTACHSEEGVNEEQFHRSVEQKLEGLTQKLTEAEATDNLHAFIGYYDERAISMPEYQITLDGQMGIENFYRKIFSRQRIKSFQRKSQEFIHMDSTIVEIGTFRKEYSPSEADSIITLSGKYWHVWHTMPDGNFRIKGE